MRIGNQNFGPIETAARSSTPPHADGLDGAGSSGRSASSEWLALLGTLREQPDVRPDAVAAAAARLAAGTLSTDEAVARTADAILRSAFGPDDAIPAISG